MFCKPRSCVCSVVYLPNENNLIIAEFGERTASHLVDTTLNRFLVLDTIPLSRYLLMTRAVKPRPHYTGEIWRRSFISTLTPRVLKHIRRDNGAQFLNSSSNWRTLRVLCMSLRVLVWTGKIWSIFRVKTPFLNFFQRCEDGAGSLSVRGLQGQS